MSSSQQPAKAPTWRRSGSAHHRRSSGSNQVFYLDGLDALLATVQMPSGIPVATVAINGAENAAILAVQMLALSDEKLAAQLDEMKDKMNRAVIEKDAKLQQELAE